MLILSPDFAIEEKIYKNSANKLKHALRVVSSVQDFCQIRLKNRSDQYVESLLLLLLQTNFQSICAPSNIGHISFISHPIIFKFCTLLLLTNPNKLYDTTPCLDPSI